MSEEIPQKLLEVLACPKCMGKIDYDQAGSRIVCSVCRLAYPVENGIPIMLPERAEKA